MSKNKVVVAANAVLGKIASLIGYVCIIIGVIGLSVELTADGMVDSFGIILAAIFLAVGIILIVRGSRIKNRIKRFRRYVSLISTQHMTSLDSLAATTSQSVDYVRKDLEKMIAKRFFANAAIDYIDNRIIIGGLPMPVQAQQQWQPAEQAPAMEVYNCRGCGATGTKQKGVVCNCDYCGSSIA
jgi:hypothetical protein